MSNPVEKYKLCKQSFNKCENPNGQWIFVIKEAMI